MNQNVVIQTRLAVWNAIILSPVHTGDKVGFNTVDFIESRRSRPCRFGPVHTGDKVERTFDIRAIVDRIGDKVDRLADNVDRIGNSRLCGRFVDGYGNSLLFR